MLVEGIGYMGEVTMVTGFIPTGAMDSSTISSSSGLLENSAQWLYEHCSPELSVQGAVTYGASFAGELKNGLGLDISPSYMT